VVFARPRLRAGGDHAESVDVTAIRARMLGAFIGKALGSIDSGVGVIEVGVTLQ